MTYKITKCEGRFEVVAGDMTTDERMEILNKLVKWMEKKKDQEEGECDRQTTEAPKMSCWCRTCRPLTMNDMRFVVCPDCGNKRCPKANDHKNACTNSNEPGQVGSAY